MLDPTSPPDYLVGHLEDALARDPRLNEQGLRVFIAGEPLTVTVTGTVVEARCKTAVVDVVSELLPGVTIHDETTVADYPEHGDSEPLS